MLLSINIAEPKVLDFGLENMKDFLLVVDFDTAVFSNFLWMISF